MRIGRDSGDWLIAGQSRAGDAHTERLLLYAEVIAGPFLLLAMFFGSLVVGLRALAPVEQSRRRQLEFTADASHELRTPLSVIRAEADVALSSPREAAQYRDALTRIRGRSIRKPQTPPASRDRSRIAGARRSLPIALQCYNAARSDSFATGNIDAGNRSPHPDPRILSTLTLC